MRRRDFCRGLGAGDYAPSTSVVHAEGTAHAPVEAVSQDVQRNVSAPMMTHRKDFQRGANSSEANEPTGTPSG